MMLNMSSATDWSPFPFPEDRTAQARIRDAAMRLFGRDGFSTTVRAIASQAGVSPALVVHHFGSKDGLRAAIDEHVAGLIREGKLNAFTGGWVASAGEYERLARAYEPYMTYLARSISDGSEAGREFYRRLHRDAVTYLQAGVEAGVLRGSADPEAWAVALLNMSLGNLLLAQHAVDVLGVEDTFAMNARLTGPLLDIYTDGLFADDRFRRSMTSETGGDRS